VLVQWFVAHSAGRPSTIVCNYTVRTPRCAAKANIFFHHDGNLSPVHNIVA